MIVQNVTDGYYINMKYCSNVMFIVLWFIAFVNCENVCDVQEGEKKCCANHQLVNGTCVECPKGWIGNDCNVLCPNGYYGVLCAGTCNCADDQICDAQDGCVQMKTVECQKGFFGEECKLPCPDGFYDVSCKDTCNCTTDQICDVQEGCVKNNTDKCPRGPFGGECQLVCPIGRYGVACNKTCNCTVDQICNAEKGCVYNNTDNTLPTMETTSTEQQTTKSNGFHEGILWNHLYGVTLGIVVIVLVVLLVYTHRKWKTIYQEIESRHDQETEEARSQAVELNKNTEESVYEEICECDTGCSHTHTFSINDTFFSRGRGKQVDQVQQMKHTILHLDAIAR